MSTTPSNPRKSEKPLTDVRGSCCNSDRSSVPAEPHADCLAYFITFHTYGSWLHGTPRGSVDRHHNVPGTAFLLPDEQREHDEFLRLKHQPVVLDAHCRTVVEQTIRAVCEHRRWQLHAINVRTNHVHVVVAAKAAPERVMNDFKSYATRALRSAGLCRTDQKIWSRHGSTPYLWTEESLERACQYVIEGQGTELPKSEPRPAEPRPAEPRPAEPRPAEPRPAEPRP